METRNYMTFSLYISLYLLPLTVLSSFSPIDHYLIDCGSTEPTTVDLDHRRFTGDSSESGSLCLSTNRAISLKDPNPPPSSSPIYHTARVFTRASKYVFKIRDRGTHLVRLHFHKFDSNFKLCNAQFHVLGNGFLLLNNFSGENTPNPRIKDYMIWVDTDELVITFVPSKRSKIAFVNAIEVISAPKDLIADVGQFVNSEKNVQISGLMKNAFETVYRVNVGGRKVTPFNDFLWRTWVPDDEFLKLSDGSSRFYSGGRIRYLSRGLSHQSGGLSRGVGPDDVYNTARLITSSNISIPNLNITWDFPVIEGYKYLVRMHLCDIHSISIGMIFFNVYINGYLAYENLGLLAMTNWVLVSPFYADFVIDGESSGVMTISVGPSMCMPRAFDTIMLIGVEIMKMNNSMGSLDGEVSAEAILKRCPIRDIGVLAPLVAAICVFLIASALLTRRRMVVRDSVAWSPIPVGVSEDDLKKGNQVNQPSLVEWALCSRLMALQFLGATYGYELRARNGKARKAKLVNSSLIIELNFKLCLQNSRSSDAKSGITLKFYEI